MAKKNHVSWHDINLYLNEKMDKRVLTEKKDHYLRELMDLKNDLNNYKMSKESEIYKVEEQLYKERLLKNKDVLDGLKMIFPDDSNLDGIIKDLKD